MSWITSYLLLHTSLEYPHEDAEDQTPAPLQQINARLAAYREHATFTRLDEHAAGSAMTGGVWGFAGNYFPMDIVLTAVAEAPWEWREMVQLLVSDDNDDNWSLLGWDEITKGS